jgi:hypothetical protein
MSTTTIRQRIEERLNLLESMLTSQRHISDPSEFVHAARWATDNKNLWKAETV